MKQKLNREELAALEIGRTAVSRPLAVSIVSCFLLCIFMVPLFQIVSDSSHSTNLSLYDSFSSLFAGKDTDTKTIWLRNTKLLAKMDGFEKEIEENSFLRDWILVPGQRALLALGAGNEKVYPGKDGWLFYRPDMDYLMGEGFLDPDTLKKRKGGGALWDNPIQPDPLKAVIDFKRQLQARGITLVLMPTPIKASLHPEHFVSGSYTGILQNRSWPEFLQQLEKANIPVFDPAPVLRQYIETKDSAAYLKTDTHWRATAMETVAKELASYLRDKFALQPTDIALQRQEKQVVNTGDIDDMLLLPPAVSPYSIQTEIIHPVLTRANELWQPSADADILLLGDSFANIFSLAGMGWGESAGLAEQLSYYLDRNLDVLLQNDAGSYATREMLSAELLRGRDRLENKKIVIWEFAARELSSGNWKMIPLELREAVESDFFAPPANQSRKVSGIVSSVSRSPMPGSVPYKDNIVTLHLVDMKDLKTGEELGQSLVYGWGMQDNVLTDLARLRVGDQIEMNCIDWDAVQMKYSSYRRSSLDDEMLELELPVWGELL